MTVGAVSFKGRKFYKIKIISEIKPYSKTNFWLIALILKKPDLKLKNNVLSYLYKNGYECRSIWIPLHRLPMFKKNPKDNLSVAEKIYGSVINLPSSPVLNYSKSKS